MHAQGCTYVASTYIITQFPGNCCDVEDSNAFHENQRCTQSCRNSSDTLKMEILNIGEQASIARRVERHSVWFSRTALHCLLYLLVALLSMRMSVLVMQIPAQPYPCFWAYSDKWRRIIPSLHTHSHIHTHIHLKMHACISYIANFCDQKCLRIIGEIVGQKLLWITFYEYIGSARLDSTLCVICG